MHGDLVGGDLYAHDLQPALNPYTSYQHLSHRGAKEGLTPLFACSQFARDTKSEGGERRGCAGWDVGDASAGRKDLHRACMVHIRWLVVGAISAAGAQ